MQRPKVLTIAASDTTCGAGIQADIRAIAMLGAHPLSCISAVTCQSSKEVRRVYPLPSFILKEQLETVLSDGLPAGVKIGVLYEENVVDCLSEVILSHGLKNIVLDPIYISSTGQMLAKEATYRRIVEVLLPLAKVITPNRREALEVLKILKGKPVEEGCPLKEIGSEIRKFGPDVIITGGDTDGCDLLCDAKGFLSLKLPLIPTRNTHGTGCVFSSALATFLAFGFDLRDAFRYAKRFVWERTKGGYPIGEGHGVLALP